MKARTVCAAALVVAGLMVGACASKKLPPKEPPHVETVTDAGAGVEEAEAPKPKSLYERLGKQEGIAKFIDTLLKNLAADTKFNKRLATVKGPKLERLKKDFVDLICVESGGPEADADCKYEGRFMREALGTKSKLKEEEWMALLVDLRTALEEHNIGDNEQQDLAAVLGKFRDEVVETPKTKSPSKK